jgi:hypothetical protein
MKKINIYISLLSMILFSCKKNADQNITSNVKDSLQLVKMVSTREIAMKNHDVQTAIAQFSDDATFINSAGNYFANKTEINNFHLRLTEMDSFSYHYKAGKINVRLLDNHNALVYYPWRMDWYAISKVNDTLEKEVGLMTLSAQKRNNRWFWVAITNQHTPEYFIDLKEHKIN